MAIFKLCFAFLFLSFSMEQTIIIDQSLLYTIPDHETNLTITLKYKLLFK